MRHILKNTSLVFVLAGLFVMPVLGFGFIKYDPSDNVLGTESIYVPVQRGSIDDDSQATNTSREYTLVKQIDLKLALSGDIYQKFYDSIPEEFVDSAYSYIVVISNDLQEQGVKAEIEVNQLKADIVVNVPDDFATQVVPISVLVLR